MPLTFGSLFAGVGGFDLGFERAGLVCKWQCEINEFCRKVLAKHWPDVRRHDDVRTFPVGDPREWRVDVICGGFPCQDISVAGKGAGIDGERSGLWSEYVRIVRVLRPRFVVVENVPALLSRGLDRVLGDMARIGHDAEWDCIPASALGFAHERRRVWIIAYPSGVGRPEVVSRQALVRHAARDGRATGNADPCGSAAERLSRIERVHREPAILGGDDGVPDRVDRLMGLGNAVVPQVAEWIGRRLIEHHKLEG